MYNNTLLGHPIMSKCSKFLTRHKPLSQKKWLEIMQKSPELDLDIDFFGSGPVVAMLENKVARLLGKEKAIFVHKGMVGQHSVLLERAAQSRYRKIAIHPQSHIEIDEYFAYKELLNLNSVMFGKNDHAINKEDIDNLPLDLSTIVVELPTRRAGFRLPEWDDLVYLNNFSNINSIPLHFDGARLFESSFYWNKSYKEVASLASSVYISLYKTIGSAAGGIIAGDKEFIERLYVWRSRLGGDISTVFPYILTSLWGLNNYLPRIKEFNQRAFTISQLFKDTFGPQSIPFQVQCNSFLVELPISASKLRKQALNVAKNDNIWLFDRIFSLPNNHSRFEIQVGDALDDWKDEELLKMLQRLI
ncbi:low specificity L-threonine aldolase [Thalassotalea sp. PP2-459]|uniref:threonine aldolase family protein n=1 Tax=Thalassotalea sp. PP2-459 TaxID=1742724 RepID=UPI000943E527|nr:beta-eliminating lyase-related protein [Thalassotalea sp. PP2-459]OKY27076.1 hypothetical protein BI291_10620 [Thalassotalea sp. PP2-459]